MADFAGWDENLFNERGQLQMDDAQWERFYDVVREETTTTLTNNEPSPTDLHPLLFRRGVLMKHIDGAQLVESAVIHLDIVQQPIVRRTFHTYMLKYLRALKEDIVQLPPRADSTFLLFEGIGALDFSDDARLPLLFYQLTELSIEHPYRGSGYFNRFLSFLERQLMLSPNPYFGHLYMPRMTLLGLHAIRKRRGYEDVFFDHNVLKESSLIPMSYDEENKSIQWDMCWSTPAWRAVARYLGLRKFNQSQRLVRKYSPNLRGDIDQLLQMLQPFQRRLAGDTAVNDFNQTEMRKDDDGLWHIQFEAAVPKVWAIMVIFFFEVAQTLNIPKFRMTFDQLAEENVEFFKSGTFADNTLQWPDARAPNHSFPLCTREGNSETWLIDFTAPSSSSARDVVKKLTGFVDNLRAAKTDYMRVAPTMQTFAEKKEFAKLIAQKYLWFNNVPTISPLDFMNYLLLAEPFEKMEEYKRDRKLVEDIVYAKLSYNIVLPLISYDVESMYLTMKSHMDRYFGSKQLPDDEERRRFYFHRLGGGDLIPPLPVQDVEFMEQLNHMKVQYKQNYLFSEPVFTQDELVKNMVLAAVGSRNERTQKLFHHELVRYRYSNPAWADNIKRDAKFMSSVRDAKNEYNQRRRQLKHPADTGPLIKELLQKYAPPTLAGDERDRKRFLLHYLLTNESFI